MVSPQLTPTPVATISDIEQIVQVGLEALRDAPLSSQVKDALKFLTPPGYRPIAQLEEDGRKKRSTAAASNWNPESGEIVIYFERQDSEPSRPLAEEQLEKSGDSNLSSHFAKIRKDPLKMTSTERHEATRSGIQMDLAARKVSDAEIEQLCSALAKAEKAGKSFIAIKWFRDTDLIAHGYSWADSLDYRQAVVTKAIEVGAIMTSSIPNPKAPQHPTTTVRLNRDSKYAQTIPPRFQPIRPSGGASASEILLHDRERW